MPLPGIRAAKSLLDEMQRDLLETEDQDFDRFFDRWMAAGLPEMDDYRGERRRGRGELLSEINRMERAIEKRPEILHEEQAGETPIMTGLRRVARGADVFQGMMGSAPQFAGKGNVNALARSGPPGATNATALPVPADFEAQSGNPLRFDDVFTTDLSETPANVGIVAPSSVALEPPSPFDEEGEEFYLGSLVPIAEAPETEPDDPENAGGSLGRIAGAAGSAVADLFDGPFGISRESLGFLGNQSLEDARTPVFGLIRTFNDVLIRGGSQAGDLALRALAAPVVGGIEATVQMAQELGMSPTDANRLRRDLYMGAEVSVAAAPALPLRPPVGRLPRAAPAAKPGSLIDRMAETGTLGEALQKVPPGQRQRILEQLNRSFDEGQRTARREFDRRGLGGAGPAEAPFISARPNPARRAADAEGARHPTFRLPDVPFVETGQEGHRAFGAIDKVSKKRIVQPRNSAPEMLALARDSVEPLALQLQGLLRDLHGVELNNVRPKEIPRLGQKLPSGRRPDTLTDYLGGRIVVDDPRMLDEVVRRLAQRYPNVEFDDFVDTARDSGYRAIHMQVMLDNGMTAEIQIMPREIFEVYKVEHPKYVRRRNKSSLTPAEFRQRRVDTARAKAAYSKAYRQWLDRIESGLH